MRRIDYFFTVLSPYAYLAGLELERIAARAGAEIAYKPIPIMRLFAETGAVSPKDRHPARVSYRLQDLERSARIAGRPLTLNPAHWPTDERPASTALIAAQAAGFAVGPAAAAILRAVWAEERNIADPATVAAILEAEGVAPALIEPGLEAAAAQFEANLAEAVAAGVFGSPFYVVGEQRFWGHDRLPHLEWHLAETAN